MAGMAIAELTGSALDDRWQRWMRRPGLRRGWAWGGPLVVTAVAAATRLAGLGHPSTLVFDETYYVKDAYTLLNLGYEGSWPGESHSDFNAGDPDGYDAAASFVAHPPLGKWIIAAGLAVFGADDPFGWRIGVAIAGILLVVVTMLIARGLFHSTLLTVIAGGLLAIDGNAIVPSRVALLDTPLALLALLGAGAVLLDRRWVEARLAGWVGAHPDRLDGWGLILLWRPWLLAAAIAFGLASGVKWSGLYFLAVFGIFVVVSDALLRRRAGIRFWGSSAALAQGPVTFLLLVPLALAVHLATWIGWFVTDGGYHRNWIEAQNGEAWTGALAWVPHDLQNWWHYQSSVMQYHVNETSPHGYQANPLSWLFLIRPTSMYYQGLPDDRAETILDIANPLIWWAGTAAIFFLIIRLVMRLIRRLPVRVEAFILTGIAAGYLPWMLYLHRTVFQFYTIAFEPYLVLALTAALGVLLGSARDPEARRVSGLLVVGVFLALCVAVSWFFWPLWSAEAIPTWYFRLHLWLPSWL
jgi:dolichyl-phosphate-mannose-protein mannosyltransferase